MKFNDEAYAKLYPGDILDELQPQSNVAPEKDSPVEEVEEVKEAKKEPVVDPESNIQEEVVEEN